MTTQDLILAIDVGTQSTKALVYSLTGEIQARHQVSYRPYFSRRPGWAEQDPDVYWQAMCQACRNMWNVARGANERIGGLTLTTQRGTVVNLDKYGHALRPAMVWLDQRTTEGLQPVRGAWGLLFGILGLKKTIAYLQAEAEANWIQTHQPDIWKKTARYLLLSGYLVHRLTGRYVDSIASQVGYLPFDYRRMCWATTGNWRWKVLPITPDMLPELVAPGRAMGQLNKEAADGMGLPAGIPVLAAAADKACEVLGSGCLTADTGCLSYGTTATVNITHNRYLEPIRLLPAYPSALPGHYSLEVQVYRGYWMVSWFKQQFGQPETQRAIAANVDTETLFEEMLEAVEPGAMGLILQPFWSPGLRFPGAEARGAVIGFGDVHTRAHLYRAILEGIAYALREGKERIERRTRIPVQKLVVTGGGSRSRRALQLTADIFDLPAARPKTDDTSALGAAINAAVGLGYHSDYSAAADAMVRTGPTIEPDPEAHQRYDALYRQVYLRLYKRLKPLYRRIRKITGYPQNTQ